MSSQSEISNTRLFFQAHTKELEEVQTSNLSHEKEIADCEERLKELNDIIAKKQDNYAKEFQR